MLSHQKRKEVDINLLSVPADQPLEAYVEHDARPFLSTPPPQSPLDGIQIPAITSSEKGCYKCTAMA